MSEMDEAELIEYYANILKYKLSMWRREKGSYKEYDNIINEHTNSIFYTGKASTENFTSL